MAEPYTCKVRQKSTAAGAGVIRFQARRKKLIRRKLDSTEQFTRVIGRADTFFFRHAEIICGDQHLHIAHQLYNGKNTDRRQHNSIACCLIETAVKCGTDFLRNAARWTTLTATAMRICQFCRKSDRICDLNNGLWAGAVPQPLAGRIILRCKHLQFRGQDLIKQQVRETRVVITLQLSFLFPVLIRSVNFN